MAPTPYVMQTWVDADSTKPVSAARLAVIEKGIFDAHYKPCVSVSAAQTLATGTLTTLVYGAGTEDYDTDGFHSTVSNTGRLVAPVSGKYHIDGHVEFAISGVGIRIMNLLLNGGGVASDVDAAPSSGALCCLSINVPVLMAAGDYVEINASQSSGGNLGVTSIFAASLFAY